MAQKILSADEQKELIGLQEVLPFKTTTHINFDNGINTGLAAEKVAPDTSISLKEPTGDVKAKFDAIDDRTKSGTNWDKIDIKSVLG